MGIFQTVADLPDVADLLQHSHRFCWQHRLQTVPIEVLHHKVWPALEVAQIVNDDNVGVAKAGGELSFTVETPQLTVLGRSVHYLDRYRPAQSAVYGFVDDTHPPFTDEVHNVVLTNLLGSIRFHHRTSGSETEIRLQFKTRGAL